MTNANVDNSSLCEIGAMTGRARILVLVLGAAAAATQPAWAEGLRLGEGSSEAAGFSPAGLARVDSTIEAAIRDEATPGAAIAIGRHGELVRMRGYGRLSWNTNDGSVTDSTLYDIASLTKVVGTTSAVMILVERAHLDLDAPIHQYLRGWSSEGEHGRITLRHLMTHTSGLPAGANLWTTPGRVEKIDRIARMELVSSPGLVTTYSDLGMIVVAAVIESVTGEQLDDFLYREVFEPLGMRDTRFNPRAFSADATYVVQATSFLAPPAASAFFEPFQLVASWLPTVIRRPSKFETVRIAPTERGVPRGYVHDRNAAAFDGVAGHSGLFSSLRDLAAFASALLQGMHGEDLPVLKSGTVVQFLSQSDGAERALGWDVARGERSSAGEFFSEGSVGHTGFTGTSIWIDPKRDLFVVLLTNRVHPSAANQKHVAMRRAVHDAVQLAVTE